MIAAAQDRLLTFEVGAGLYGLPIAYVAEVGEVGRLSCIPTLPLSLAGVMNHHGDALPVLRRGTLLELDEAALPDPGHVLALSARPNGAARLGLPVDRVLGLVDGVGARARGEGAVAERRPLGDRVLAVLDPERLLERAKGAVGQPPANKD